MKVFIDGSLTVTDADPKLVPYKTRRKDYRRSFDRGLLKWAMTVRSGLARPGCAATDDTSINILSDELASLSILLAGFLGFRLRASMHKESKGG
jgi:hypothetical protein